MRNALVSAERPASVWSLMNDFDEMFERAWRDPFSLMGSVAPSIARDSWDPGVETRESDEAYLFSVDVPGVRRDDLKIEVADGVLTISGERRRGGESGSREDRRFVKRFSVPGSVDLDKIEANLEDGVLHVLIPKSEGARPRRIEVRAGTPGFFQKLLGSKEKEVGETKTH